MHSDESDLQVHVRTVLRDAGARAAYQQFIAENDALILSPRLDHGRAITTARTAIHTTLVAAWAEEQQQRLGYDKPFAVVALGGTGCGKDAAGGCRCGPGETGQGMR